MPVRMSISARGLLHQMWLIQGDFDQVLALDGFHAEEVFLQIKKLAYSLFPKMVSLKMFGIHKIHVPYSILIKNRYKIERSAWQLIPKFEILDVIFLQKHHENNEMNWFLENKKQSITTKYLNNSGIGIFQKRFSGFSRLPLFLAFFFRTLSRTVAIRISSGRSVAASCFIFILHQSISGLFHNETADSWKSLEFYTIQFSKSETWSSKHNCYEVLWFWRNI